MGRLIHGDCLAEMRGLRRESVDLCYMDPPFNSGRNYALDDGAFGDRWLMTEARLAERDELAKLRPSIARLIALATVTHGEPMGAYLCFMGIRILAAKAALKRRTGSLYLHCDDTAVSHLRILLDAIFGPDAFRNQIAWLRARGHKSVTRKWPRVHDHLLFYAGADAPFEVQWVPYDPDYVRRTYRFDDGDGRGPYYKTCFRDMSGSRRHSFRYRGFAPPPKGWAYSKARMDELHADGRLWYPENPDGTPAFEKRILLKTYLAEGRGVQVRDLWLDIKDVRPMNPDHVEYPTQKPSPLLERILAASTRPGDVVLDPFCGSGTTAVAAVRTGREWICIDRSADAIAVTEKRVKAAETDLAAGEARSGPHGDDPPSGTPDTPEGAEGAERAAQGPDFPDPEAGTETAAPRRKPPPSSMREIRERRVTRPSRASSGAPTQGPAGD